MTSYVNTNEVVRKQHWFVKVISLIIIMLATLAIAVPASMSAVSNASWIDDILCGNDLGGGTSIHPANNVLTDGSDTIMSEGGKYSIMDLYGNVVSWTTWNGANVGDEKKSVINFDAAGVSDLKDTAADVQKVADGGIHNAVGCVSNYFTSIIGNIFLNFAAFGVTIMSTVVSWAVNPKIICQDPANPEGACINLIKIIGGDGGSNGGIIGTLYNGLYLSLASVVFVVVAGWMLWKGIVKGQIRNAWVGLGWAFLSFVLGVMVLTNPMLLAQAPMKVSVMLGSCVIESINGRSCLATDTDSVTQTEDGTANPNTICLIDPNKDFGMDEHLAIDARMSTCKMWKAFVLEPWAEGQFGASYESLEAKDGASYQQSDMITQSDKKDKLTELWPNLSVSMKADNINGLCKGSDYKYYNIALYQLDLMSNLHDCAGSDGGTYHSSERIKKNGSVYNDWYYMIFTAASASGDKGDGKDNISHMFTMWSGQASLTRTSLAIVAAIATVLASGLFSLFDLRLSGIIGWSILAICYLFMGVILTMFAPLFMLAGIHPGTGKKIFLGWLELELEAVLKYFFLMLWLCVVVEIYGAILGSTTNAGMTLIFVLAITAALKMYEPELRNIFGNVDLGGKKLSNKMGEKFGNFMQGARGMKNTLAGGAAAGFMAGEGGLKNRFRNAGDMAAYQGMQQGKRMGGFAGAAFQAADKIYDDRRRNALTKANQQNEQAQQAANSAAATAAAATQDFEDKANAGLLDENGKDLLDYSEYDTEEKIDALADQRKADLLAKGDNAAIYELGHEIDADFEKKQDEEFAKYAGETTTDEHGVVHYNEGASDTAVEYARRQNEKLFNELNQKKKTGIDSDGKRVAKFDSIEDQIAYEQAQKALTDQRTVDNHNDYMQNYAGAAHEDYVRERLKLAKDSGRITNQDLTVDDLRAQGAALSQQLTEIDSRRANSKEALKQINIAANAQEAAERMQTQANAIKSMNEEVTQRSAGRMWSGKEVRRLEARSQQMDASLGAGHGLDDVQVTSISNGAARIRDIQNGSRAVAAGVAAAPGAVVNGAVAMGNTLSGSYEFNEDGKRVFVQGNAGTRAKEATAQAIHDASENIRQGAQTVVQTAQTANNAIVQKAQEVRQNASQAYSDMKDSAEQTLNRASGTNYIVSTADPSVRYEDTPEMRKIMADANARSDDMVFERQRVDGNFGTKARHATRTTIDTTEKVAKATGRAAVSGTKAAARGTAKAGRTLGSGIGAAAHTIGNAVHEANAPQAKKAFGNNEKRDMAQDAVSKFRNRNQGK